MGREEEQMEHTVEDQPLAQQGEISVHSCGVRRGDQRPVQQDHQPCRQQRQQLQQHAEQETPRDQIALGHRERQREGDVVVLPGVHTEKEDRQGDVEKADAVGIVGDQDQGAEAQHDPTGGVQAERPLFFQQFQQHAQASFSMWTMISSRLQARERSGKRPASSLRISAVQPSLLRRSPISSAAASEDRDSF